MSAMVRPLIVTFEAGAAISKGQAVKFSTDNKTVIKCAAATDKVIGIAQNTVVNVGDLCEVAMGGGGGKALAKTTIALGDRLGVNADASIQKVAAQGDSEFAQALDAAAAGDIFSVMIKPNTSAYASQA